jgi:hypothetical protein
MEFTIQIYSEFEPVDGIPGCWLLSSNRLYFAKQILHKSTANLLGLFPHP